MKQLSNWFSANKISLNVEKTELVCFKSVRKVLSGEIKIKLTRKRLHPSNSVKYLGVRIDQFLHWHDQANNIAVKLNRVFINVNTVNRLIILQKKAQRIMNVKDQLFYSSPLFSEKFFLRFYLRKYTFCQ